jgi:AcrR family transcriptional regulator
MTDRSVTDDLMAPPLRLDAARRRAPDERPQQIIDAALAVFDERGLAGAHIAQRAGIAKGTIYLYFPNKEELFREVIRQTLIDRLDQARIELDATAELLSAPEQIRRYMERTWEFLTTPAYQAVYRLVLGELHRFPDLAEFYAREVVTRAHGLMASIIDRGVARGELRPIEPAIASRIMSSMLATHSIWVCRRHVFKTFAELTPDEVRDQLIDFTLRALRPDPPAE